MGSINKIYMSGMHAISEVTHKFMCKAVDTKSCKWNCRHQKGEKDIYVLYDLQPNLCRKIGLFTSEIHNQFEGGISGKFKSIPIQQWKLMFLIVDQQSQNLICIVVRIWFDFVRYSTLKDIFSIFKRNWAENDKKKQMGH